MELPHNTLYFSAIASVVLGVLQCFCGYRLFKFILAVTGFALGAALAGSMAFDFFENEMVSWIAGFIGGLIGASLMGMIYLVGVFIIGACLGGVFGYVAFSLLEKEPMLIVIAILALIFGAASLIYQKFMIIIATGFCGAWYIIAGSSYLLEKPVDENIYLAAGGWLVLSIIGTATQFRAYRKTL